MTDFLFSIDSWLFYAINHGWSNPVFDVFFSFITNVRNWIPVYIVVCLGLLIKGGKKGRLAVVLALIMIAVTDQTGYRLLKETIGRARPFITLPDVFLPNGKAGNFSFPSNHALNNFAEAMFFSVVYPKASRYLFTFASLVALSRVYLGVHYPSDIAGGAILGLGFGFLFSRIYIALSNRFGIEPAQS